MVINIPKRKILKEFIKYLDCETKIINCWNSNNANYSPNYNDNYNLEKNAKIFSCETFLYFYSLLF